MIAVSELSLQQNVDCQGKIIVVINLYISVFGAMKCRKALNTIIHKINQVHLSQNLHFARNQCDEDFKVILGPRLYICL